MAQFHENWYPTKQLIELKSLIPLVRELEGDCIEIGCWEGRSAHTLANELYPDTLICNDTWKGNVVESKLQGSENISERIAKTRDVFAVFKNNMDVLTKGNYTVVREDCLEWLKTIERPVKFCHIDASHDYKSVFDTIQLLLPHVVKGGILCGDDFENACMSRHDLQGGVERAVREALPNFKQKGNLWYWIN